MASVFWILSIFITPKEPLDVLVMKTEVMVLMSEVIMVVMAQVIMVALVMLQVVIIVRRVPLLEVSGNNFILINSVLFLLFLFEDSLFFLWRY